MARRFIYSVPLWKIGVARRFIYLVARRFNYCVPLMEDRSGS